MISSDHTITQALRIQVASGKTVDVKIAVRSGPAVSADSLEVSGARDVEITSANDQVSNCTVTVVDARNVTIQGNTSNDSPAVRTAYIACSGQLLVENTGDGSATGGSVAGEDGTTYVNTSNAETVYRSNGDFWGALAPYEDTWYGNATRRITAGAEPTYTLTVKNGYSTRWDETQEHTTFYAGEEAEVHGVRPADALEFVRWDFSEPMEIEESHPSEPSIVIHMPSADATVSGVWKKADNDEITVVYTYGDETLNLTPSHLPEDGTMTFENGVLTIDRDFDQSSDGDMLDLKLQGLADPATGALPSVVLNGTVTGNLTVDGLQDVTVTTSDDTYGAIDGWGEIRCSGDVTIENTNGLAVYRSLYVQDARNVTVKAKTADDYAIHGSAEITCSGDIIIENDIGGGVYYDLYVFDAQNVTVTADNADAAAVDDEAVITCGGDVTLTNRSGSVVNYPLTIDSARNVTVEGCTADDDNLIGYHDSEEHTIRCSGTVTLRNNGTGALFTNQLTYRPDSSVEVYTIQVDGQTMRENAAGDTVFTIGQPDSTAILLADVSLDDTADETPADTWNNDLTGARELVITPTLRPVDPGDAADPTDQFAADASGVLVSAALGGAAIWGGYEVITRVMLHQMLPEGTAIPTTRGQLAMLLWETAGKPEASATVAAYADIADADLQAAARWCTEQGLLTARKDGTFAPDAWTPKWQVIQVWEQAFANT